MLFTKYFRGAQEIFYLFLIRQSVAGYRCCSPQGGRGNQRRPEPASAAVPGAISAHTIATASAGQSQGRGHAVVQNVTPVLCVQPSVSVHLRFHPDPCMTERERSVGGTKPPIRTIMVGRRDFPLRD